MRVHHESDVGEARRAAVRMAALAGHSETRSANVALLATELATNLVRHAQGGELVIQALTINGESVVELISLDSGPGIADIERCMADGYSTGGTLGAGLGAVRRMADTFDIYSRVEWGTILFARVRASEARTSANRFEWGCISLPVAQEKVCGDAWTVQIHDDEMYVMVADGLGHGPLAAEASQAAQRVFDAEESCDPKAYLERAHRALKSTRGAAISVAHGSASGERLVFAGVGNVAGAIVSAEEHRAMASHNGTIGAILPRVQCFEYEWPDRALVVLHSDGLKTRWNLRDYRGLHLRHPTLVAAALYKDFRRASDDITVLVSRRMAA